MKLHGMTSDAKQFPTPYKRAMNFSLVNHCPHLHHSKRCMRNPQSSVINSELANTVSPNVGTFSPRPGNHGIMSLHETLMMDSVPTSSMATSPSRSTVDPSHRPSGSGNSQDISLALLDRDGFTRDVLFRFKAQDIAHSLFIFNRYLLEGLPENLTSGDCLTSIPASIEYPLHPSPDFLDPAPRSSICLAARRICTGSPSLFSFIFSYQIHLPVRALPFYLATRSRALHARTHARR
jgi:hypothetical protein